jgi:hypothetical protein
MRASFRLKRARSAQPAKTVGNTVQKDEKK